MALGARARGRCREFPSVIELASYVFCFHGIMCGPFCFYKDYIAFIDGSNYSRHATATDNGVSNWRRGSGGGGGAPSLTGDRHLSSRADGDVVSASDGRSGNNSHGRLAPPPDPRVSCSSHTSFIYSTRNGFRCSCCRCTAV